LPNDPTYGGNTDNEFTKQYGKHEGMYYVPQRAAAGLDPWAQPQAYDNIKDFFNVGTTWLKHTGYTCHLYPAHTLFGIQASLKPYQKISWY